MKTLFRSLTAVACFVCWQAAVSLAARAFAGASPPNDDALPYLIAISGTADGLWASWLGVSAWLGRPSFWIGFLVAFVVAFAFFGCLLIALPLALDPRIPAAVLVSSVDLVAIGSTPLAIGLGAVWSRVAERKT